MLLIDVSQIPPEGLDIREDLVAAEVHVEAEGTFALQPGGSVHCHVDKVDNASVHVRGRLRAALGLECSRCLEPYALDVDQDLDLFYLPHAAGQGDEEEQDVELKDRDMVVAYYHGDRLDLGDVLREQLFLATPLKPLCRADCRGRCPSCGADRNRAACACPAPEAEADPRLLQLKKLLDARSH
jgi:uncharacterized protein